MVKVDLSLSKRHIDTGAYLHQFWQNEHWLVCPCGRPVIAHYSACPHCGSLRHHIYCKECHYHKNACQDTIADTLWHVTLFCDSCRQTHHLYPTSANGQLSHALRHKTLACPTCTKLATVIKAKQIDTTYPPYQGAFGLELYLREPTPLGEIWAYNPKHLAALKTYVSADLRERTKQASNSSYFSRLPTWIKSAKHRDDILKAISKLEQAVHCVNPDTDRSI